MKLHLKATEALLQPLVRGGRGRIATTVRPLLFLLPLGGALHLRGAFLGAEFVLVVVSILSGRYILLDDIALP